MPSDMLTFWDIPSFFSNQVSLAICLSHYRRSHYSLIVLAILILEKYTFFLITMILLQKGD